MARRYCYLDACTVASWCCAPVSAVPIDLECGRVLDQLLADADVVVALSELTLVETHDVLSKLLRSTDPSTSQYDVAWFEQALGRVMALLGSRRVEVVASPPKAAEHALVLVTVASRDHGAKLKAWDAVHIITASGWARSLQNRVALVTADSDFEKFLALEGHFSALLDLEQITA